jgi:hypothetical protein
MKTNKFYSPDFEAPEGGTGEVINNSSDKNLVKDVAESNEFDFDTELSNLINDAADEDETPESKAKDFAPPSDKKETVDEEDEPLYKVLAEQLKAEGLFDDEDFQEDDDFKFDGTPDSFKSLMERRDFKRGIKIFEDLKCLAKCVNSLNCLWMV